MIEVSMASQGSLGRRDIGVTLVRRAFLGPLERMESGETTGRSGPGGCPESRDLVDSLAPKAPLESPGPRESAAWTGRTVPKGAWDPRVSQDPLDSRAHLGPRVSPGLRVPSALMVRRGLRGSQDFPACLAQTDSRVTPGRKAPLEPKETRAHLDLRVL